MPSKSAGNGHKTMHTLHVLRTLMDTLSNGVMHEITRPKKCMHAVSLLLAHLVALVVAVSRQTRDAAQRARRMRTSTATLGAAGTATAILGRGPS